MPCNIMTEMYPQDSVAGSPYPSGYAFLLRESDLTVEAKLNVTAVEQVTTTFSLLVYSWY